MITRCPECGTKFRISVDLIRAEDSTVRCGDCMAVFDARAQLVDEATESSYLVDSARERATRTRYEQQLAGTRQTQNHPQGAGEFASDPAQGSANSQREPLQPRSRIVFDQRETTADIDLDSAQTIAYEPVLTDRPQSRSAASDSSRGGRPAHARPAHGGLLRPQAPVDPDDRSSEHRFVPASGSQNPQANPQSRSQQGSQQSGQHGSQQRSQPSLDLDLAHRDVAETAVADNYSRRIDPLINPDDKAFEFEQTLALERAGIESGYSEMTERQRLEAAAGAKTAGDVAAQTKSYVGEHQFNSPAPSSVDAIAGAAGDYGHNDPEEIRTPRSKLRMRIDYSNDPDIVNPSTAVPRSERHLNTGELQQQDQSASAHQNYGHSHERNETPLNRRVTDLTVDGQGGFDSASEMRQHVTERGVAIDSEGSGAELQQGSSNSFGWLFLALLAVASAAAFFSRDDIAKSNLPEPIRAAFCSVAGCELPVATDVTSLELLRQKIYSHASIDNALVISVDVINNAVFPQPYPILAITMANSKGEAVAQRDFEPKDYLENYTGNETLTANKPTRINIDVVDPGEDAQSFEMEFR